MRHDEYEALVQLSAECIAESRMWSEDEVLTRIQGIQGAAATSSRRLSLGNNDSSSRDSYLTAMDSLFRQLYQRYILKIHHIHRKENRVRYYWKLFRQGKTIWNLAKEVQFSPYLLCRVLLERQHLAEPGTTDSGEISKPLPKKTVSKLVQDTSLIEDAKLREQVKYCRDNDPLYSPQVDEKRKEIGEHYESKLYDILNANGIPFETEEDLRQQGLSKTPDALLTVPMGVLSPEGKACIVNWIDSKAMFGDPITHKKNSEQYLGYINRFGPGLVIYWFDFLEEEKQSETRSYRHVDKEKNPLSAEAIFDLLTDAPSESTGPITDRDILVMSTFPTQFISPGSTTVCRTAPLNCCD